MIDDFSNPLIAERNAKSYLGKNAKLLLSSRKDKKYMIIHNNKKVHFGAMGYEDFTKHKNKERRDAYLKRATKIKGDWKDNKYSPNNLAINILWK
jgi:hypothetical protein